MNINRIVAECNPFELPSVSYAQKEELPHIVALYFVLYEKQIFYIGTSICLKKRWDTHELKIIINRDRYPTSQVRIAWIEHPDLEVNLKRIEKCAIELFKPVYNKKRAYGTVEWLSRSELWKSRDSLVDKPVDKAVDSLVDLSVDSTLDSSMDALVDKLPLKDLESRYGITRSLLYRRMNDLGIKPTMLGNKGYLDASQIDLLDKLHEHIRDKKGQTAEFLEIMGLSTKQSTEQSTSQMSNGLSSTSLTATLPGQWIEVYDRLAEIARPLSFQQIPPPNPWDNYEQLDLIADRNWVIPTSKLLPLLSRKSIPKLDDHNRFNSHGFTFWKSGKMGNEYGWRVTKQQV